MMVDWDTKKLGDLCEFKNGLWKGKKEPYTHVGVIRNTNFTKGGYLDDSDIAYLDVETKQYASRKLQFGDIILEKSGGGPKQAVGRVILFNKKDGEFSFSNFTSVVRVLNPNELDHSYLHRLLHFYYVAGATEPMQKHSTGIRNLQLKEYKELPVPLPPLTEQKRIVAILDKAFAGIDAAVANTEKNLANARELFESYLNGVFIRKGDGWVEKKLGECFRLKSGDGLTSKAMIAGVYSVFGGNGVAGTHNQYNLTGENVIIGRVGALCGNARHIKEKIWLTDNAFKVVDQKYSFDSAFLTHLLNFKNLRSFARQAAQPVISNSSLKNIDLNFPESEVEQRLVVERLDALKCESNNLEAIYQQKLSALAELKQSILQKAFAGKLTTLPEKTLEEAVA